MFYFCDSFIFDLFDMRQFWIITSYNGCEFKYLGKVFIRFYTDLPFRFLILLPYSLRHVFPLIRLLFYYSAFRVPLTKKHLTTERLNLTSRCFLSGLVRGNGAPNATISAYLFRLFHCLSTSSLLPLSLTLCFRRSTDALLSLLPPLNKILLFKIKIQTYVSHKST